MVVVPHIYQMANGNTAIRMEVFAPHWGCTKSVDTIRASLGWLTNFWA